MKMYHIQEDFYFLLFFDFWPVKPPPHTHAHILWAIKIALGYPIELDDKTLLLKTPDTWVIRTCRNPTNANLKVSFLLTSLHIIRRVYIGEK